MLPPCSLLPTEALLARGAAISPPQRPRDSIFSLLYMDKLGQREVKHLSRVIKLVLVDKSNVVRYRKRASYGMLWQNKGHPPEGLGNGGVLLCCLPRGEDP